MARPAGVTSAVVATVTVLVLAGCSGGSDPTASAPPPSPTPLAELDTSAVAVARASFCARVAPAAVADALGSEPDDAVEWANGERAPLGEDDEGDVAHEFGCRWTAADGTTATAWVFAPPVSRRGARALAEDAVTEGCSPVTGAPAFGAPSVAVRCEDGTTSFHGLFGDAWLSCALAGAPGAAAAPDAAAPERWCAAVLQAAAVSP